MAEPFDLLIRNGIVATPNGIAQGDVGVTGGRIAAIGQLGMGKAANGSDPAPDNPHIGGDNAARRRHRSAPDQEVECLAHASWVSP